MYFMINLTIENNILSTIDSDIKFQKNVDKSILLNVAKTIY